MADIRIRDLTREEYMLELIKEKYGNVRRFAEESGIPYTTIRSVLERGVSRATHKTLDRICEALGVRSADFDFWMGKETPEPEQLSFTKTSINTKAPGPNLDLDDVIEILNDLHSRPEMKILFDRSKKATKEEIEQVTQLLELFAKNKQD